jgi:hypothetical protein
MVFIGAFFLEVNNKPSDVPQVVAQAAKRAPMCCHTSRFSCALRWDQPPISSKVRQQPSQYVVSSDMRQIEMQGDGGTSALCSTRWACAAKRKSDGVRP